MLGERLKSRSLFKAIEEVKADKEREALDMLEECVDNLILGMATVERLGIFSREDIEDYVIAYIEEFEKRYYLRDEDAFDKFIRDYLWG